jgi:O-antigen ligase
MKLLKQYSSPLWPALGIASVWMASMIGQFGRADFFSGGRGPILMDLITAACAVWGMVLLVRRREEVWGNTVARALLFFAAAVVLSLIIASLTQWNGFSAFVTAVSYTARLVTVLLFAAALSVLPASKLYVSVYLRYMLAAAFGMLLVGVMLYVLLPNFAAFANFGWDPHIGRLSGSWLDPNYFGSFIAILVVAAIGKERSVAAAWRWPLIATVVMGSVALWFTVSRSALLTLLVGFAVVFWFSSIRSKVLMIIIAAVLLIIPGRLQDRVADSASFVDAGTSGATQEQLIEADPTANARQVSWTTALSIFAKQPVTGSGYGYYEQAAIRNGLIESTTRGTASSDSSILTILATTGIVGLAAFIWLVWVFIFSLWSKRSNYFGLALATLCALIVGSTFNNLWLYPLFFPLWIIGMTLLVRHDR